MKTLNLSLTIFSSIALLAQAAQGASAPGVAPGGTTVVLATGLYYTYEPGAPSPWHTGERIAAGRLAPLLAELQGDIETVLPALSSLTSESADSSVPQVASVDSAVAQYATGFGTLPARDLSTLVSQDLSANLAQNLSTSLAVPTCPPWSTWGNGPVMVLANVGGNVIGIPSLPPRTAWGNGLGTVVTTPGGAVYTLMPGYSLSQTNADTGTARDALRQLAIVQDDLARLRTYLATANQTNTIAPPATPSPDSPPVYLSPTGR